MTCIARLASTMPVEFKDYYEVLGLARDASDGEIKKAFRKLARQYHPDVAKNKVTAEENFKELNEANEVLSDPEKRRKYDELGENWNHPERQTAPPQGGFGGGKQERSEFHFGGTGFSDFFEQFFGSRGRTTGGFGQNAENGSGGALFARRGQDVEGDMYATVAIQVPSHLTPEQKIVWEQLAAEPTFNPRKST
jgi:curved DNA-binding protein